MPKKRKPTKPLPKPAVKRKRGRPEGTGFIPTVEQRNMVEAMAGMVIPDDVICRLLLYEGNPIGESTLKKHFRQELSQGRAKLRVRHGQALFKAVEDGNVTAMIWWDKTRNQVREKIGFEAPIPGEIGADPEKSSMLEVARRVAFVLTMGAEAAPKTAPPAPAVAKPKRKHAQPA